MEEECEDTSGSQRTFKKILPVSFVIFASVDLYTFWDFLK